MRSSTDNLSGRSDLLPRTRSGIPARLGLLRSSWSSSVATGNAARSAASTIYLSFRQPKINEPDDSFFKVWYSHDCVNTLTVPLPHQSKPGLTSDVPTTFDQSEYTYYFSCAHETHYTFGVDLPIQTNVTLLNLLGVEANRWNGAREQDKG